LFSIFCCIEAGYRNSRSLRMFCSPMAHHKQPRHPAGGNGKQIFRDAWWLLVDAPPAPGKEASVSPQTQLVSTQPTGAAGISSDSQARTSLK
jgi:hypothetical protein